MLRYLLFWFIMMTCGALSIFIFQDLQCSYIAYVFSAGLKSSFCIFWTRALFKNGIVHKKNCAVDMHVTAVQYSAVRSESLQMSVCVVAVGSGRKAEFWKGMLEAYEDACWCVLWM